MKVLLVNGSPHKKGTTSTALSEVAAALEREGMETEMIHIGAKPVQGCIACLKCRKTHRCFYDEDVANKVIKKMQNYPNLYHIKLENSSAIITDKFLDALDKEIREAIRINIIKSTIDLTKGLQPIDYGKA